MQILHSFGFHEPYNLQQMISTFLGLTYTFYFLRKKYTIACVFVNKKATTTKTEKTKRQNKTQTHTHTHTKMIQGLDALWITIQFTGSKILKSVLCTCQYFASQIIT